MSERLSTIGTWWIRESQVVVGSVLALVGALAIPAVLRQPEAPLPAVAVPFVLLLVGLVSVIRGNRLADVWLEGEQLRLRRRGRQWHVPLTAVLGIRDEPWWFGPGRQVILTLTGSATPAASVYFLPAVLRELGGPATVADQLRAAIAGAAPRRAGA